MALIIGTHTVRSRKYELQVWEILRQWRNSEADLNIFANNFWREIEAMKRLSVGKPSDFYKLLKHPIGVREWEQPTSVELWHKDSLGDLDRKVATITLAP
jgi:hypothetical protein